MASFCKPFTKATIRYFDHAESAERESGWWNPPPPLLGVGELRQSWRPEEAGSLQESDPLGQTAQRLTTF